jgi:hypothetical protein
MAGCCALQHWPVPTPGPRADGAGHWLDLKTVRSGLPENGAGSREPADECGFSGLIGSPSCAPYLAVMQERSGSAAMFADGSSGQLLQSFEWSSDTRVEPEPLGRLPKTPSILMREVFGADAL